MGDLIGVGFSFGLQGVARLVGLQSEEAILMVWVSISDGLGLSKGAIFSTLVSISEVVLCT